MPRWHGCGGCCARKAWSSTASTSVPTGPRRAARVASPARHSSSVPPRISISTCGARSWSETSVSTWRRGTAHPRVACCSGPVMVGTRSVAKTGRRTGPTWSATTCWRPRDGSWPRPPTSDRPRGTKVSATDSARATLRWILIAAALFVWLLPDIALLVAYAILLADVLLPAVERIAAFQIPRGRRLPRGVAAALVVLVLVVTAGAAVALSIPRIVAEAVHLASGAPEVLTRMFQSLERFAAERGLSAWLDPIVDNARVNAAALVRGLAGTLAGLAGKFFSGIGHLLGFALLPLLTFYLLADSSAVRSSALSFVPEEARGEVMRLGDVVGRALGSYVRGQAIVCVVTGAALGIALAATRHPAALLLGILAGPAELIAYVGFLVPAVTIVLAGLTVSPFQALLGLGIYIALNWTIGVFVTPRVMGRFLHLHPFIVTVSVLAGAQLLGPAGALLALPGAAVLQAIMGEMARAPERSGSGARTEAGEKS